MKEFTVLCYLNGDNDLAEEILHSVDMMETVGSSADMNIVALVDGHPAYTARYGSGWQGTKLLYIEKDTQIGRICSTVLEDRKEQDLGDPATLAHFIQDVRERFPARRYLFFMFTHGSGVIDTGGAGFGRLPKSAAFSPDVTAARKMSLPVFADAMRQGLGTDRFDLSVFFSCLTGMVEIGYALRDLTDYIIASEDEIRMVNDPPGAFQVRGIQFEKLLAALQADPALPPKALGRTLIEPYIDQYRKPVVLTSETGDVVTCRLTAGLAMIRTRDFAVLSSKMDRLARSLIRQLDNPQTVSHTARTIHQALGRTQSFRSFLNLEYHDLIGFLERLAHLTRDDDVARLAHGIIQLVSRDVIVDERHTPDCDATGLSVYLPSFLVPDNVFEQHHQFYRESGFSRDTKWDEMAAQFRRAMRRSYPDYLVDQVFDAAQRPHGPRLQNLNAKIVWSLRKQLQQGQFNATRRYMTAVAAMTPEQRPHQALTLLHTFLTESARIHPQGTPLVRQVAGFIKKGYPPLPKQDIPF